MNNGFRNFKSKEKDLLASVLAKSDENYVFDMCVLSSLYLFYKRQVCIYKHENKDISRKEDKG